MEHFDKPNEKQPVVSVRPETPNDLVDYTEEEESATVKRIDMVVLPVMCLVYFMQYIDKQLLSYTVVFGLKEDLNLVGEQYSWLSSGFYIAQLASQVWNTFAVSRFPIKAVTGISIILWGVACLCHAIPNSFPGFLATRIVLGFIEGIVSISFVVITSCYYRKKEHATRVASWVSMNAIAQVIGNFLVYGVAKNPSLKLSVWKVSYLICGSMTLAAGIIFLLVLPLSPLKAWFLNERQQTIAVQRILVESDRGERNSFNKQQLVESLSFDWITYSSFFFGFLVTVTSGPIVFLSLYLSQMGYTGFKVLEYGAPSGAVQLIAIWVGVALCYKWPDQRCLIIMFLTLVPIVGNILLLALPEENHWAGIVGSWLGSCITSFMSITISLNASNVRGNTKKSVVNSAFYLGYDLAAIIYPQWWNYSKDPRYRVGLAVDIAFWVIFEILVFSYRLMAKYENKKRDNMTHIEPYDEDHDLTDKQDKYHRYSY